jgi:ribonuclease PH
LLGQGILTADPQLRQVAAVSVGMVGEGETSAALLDLAYAEDSRAAVDLNVVMLAGGGLVEVQGTGERTTFSRADLNTMLDLADGGIRQLMAAQQAALRGAA